MSELIVVKTGVLKPRQRKALEEGGAVVVETDDLSCVRRISLEPTPITGDEMTVAIIESVLNGPTPGSAIAVLGAIGETIKARLERERQHEKVEKINHAETEPGC